MFNDIVAQESSFLNSSGTVKIQEKISELNRLKWTIHWRTPAFLVNAFQWLSEQRQKFNNQTQAKSLLEAGQLAITSQNYDRLSEVVRGLFNLLPQDEQDKAKGVIGIR